MISLKMPDATSLSPGTWYAFIRSDDVPDNAEKWGYKKMIHSGYEKEYTIKVWEKGGVGYWHSDMYGIMEIDKALLKAMPNVRYMEGWEGLYFGLENLEREKGIIQKTIPKVHLAKEQRNEKER